LDFRDYLRAFPDDRSGADTERYADAKTDFVREIERRATEWRARGSV